MGILTDDMKRLVREQRLGFWATVSPDGTPNLSPKGTTAIWDDDHLFFADLRSPDTVANVRGGSGVEVNVVDPFARKGYRFKGTAVVHAPGAPLYSEGLERLRKEGFTTAQSRIRSIVVIEVKRARAIVSPAYDDGTEEPVITQTWIHHYGRLHERRRAGTGSLQSVGNPGDRVASD